MTKKEYPLLHTMMQKFGSSRPGAWFFARTLHHFDRVLLKLTNNKTTLTSILSGLPVVILTCKGAKSGQLRSLPLLCIQESSGAGKFALVASNWGQQQHPAWYYNLKANPQAKCDIKGQVGDYLAYEASGNEYDSFWQAAMDTYMGFPHYQKRVGNRHIPIMVMEPMRG